MIIKKILKARLPFTPEAIGIYSHGAHLQRFISIGKVLILTTLFVLMFQVAGLSQAPDIQWRKTFGGSDYDEAESILQTSDGGYILAGWTYSTDGDGAGSHGSNSPDFWIIKMDPAGNIQWKKMIGGDRWDVALSIRQTRDGGYIIAGHTYSTNGDLPYKPGDFSSDALVVKLDPSGNIMWLKTFGGIDNDVLISISETQDGGYIAAGYTLSNNGDISGNHGDQDGWVVKLNNTGNLQWQKCIGGTKGDNAWSVTLSPDGGYVFTGHTKSVDGDMSFNRGQFDIMVGKLDASGNLKWIRTMGGSRDEWALSIAPASDGGYVIAGYSFSNDGDLKTNYGSNDCLVIKIDLQGNMQWNKSFGGFDYDDANEIAQTSDGGYIVAGRTRSISGDVSANNGGNDYWILKLDVNGSLQWEKSLGGSLQDVAYSVQQTLDGGYIIAGTTYSGNGDVTANFGKSDAWIVKLGVCNQHIPELTGDIVGNATPCAGSTIGFKIAEANEATGYTWKIPNGWAIVSGQGTNAITVLVGNNAGIVSVLAYNSCKSSAERTLPVTAVIPELPQVTIKSDAGPNICQDAPVLFTAEVTFATSPTFQWKKNGINAGTNSNVYRDISVKNGDIITCEITSINDCGTPSVVISRGITMSVSPFVNPTIRISANTDSICLGKEVQFTTTVTGEGLNPVYQWYINNGATGSVGPSFSSHSLSDGDIITCRLISSEVCSVSQGVSSNPIKISVDARIEATAKITATATTICKDDEITFQAVAENAGTSPMYTWTINGVPAGSNSPVFATRTLANSNEVLCTVTPGLNTCAANPALSNKIQITLNPLPQLLINPVDTVVALGAQIQFNTYISEDIRSFKWSPEGMLVNSAISPTTVPIESTTTFRLSIVTKDGCPMYQDVTIQPFIPLLIPNAFTPNGDGKNDIFRIPPGTNFSLKEFSIYNRWGERVFVTTDINTGWDGRIKGVHQSSGVYVYKISGFQNDKPVFLNGTFTIIH